MSRHVVIGTAGHIDHGKTALVRALTGTDTDRLAEEKRRGITIDLGFAHMTLPGGATASIVDVPGHEDFIRNMVAGAAGVNVALLVVAADEGVMPQTREHLDILRMLDVPAAVIALTKSDLVEADWLALAEDDLRSALAHSPYAGAEVVPVSARTAAGLDRLRAALDAAVAGAPAARGIDRVRMPIDRGFTMHGTGTVVTGTVRDGVLENGAELRVLPAGRTVRVRALQHHGNPVAAASAAMRAAAALAGIEREAAGRGSWLVSPDWPMTSTLSVELDVVPDSRWEVRQRQRVRLHMGTAEVMARVVLLDAVRVGAGERALAQLRLESPVVARYGDRFVVRSFSPVATIGGGRVLETIAPRRRSRDPEGRRILAALADDPLAAFPLVVDAAGYAGIPESELQLRFGPGAAQAPAAGVARLDGALVSCAHLDRLGAALADAVAAWHREHPLRPGIERSDLRRAVDPGAAGVVDAVIDALVAEGRLIAVSGQLALPDFTPRADPGQAAARDSLERAYLEAGLAPPRLSELPDGLRERADLRDLVRMLERDGILAPFPPDRLIHTAALADARVRLDALAGRADLGPADFREAFDLPRRQLIPLLELFDRLGWTVRAGDSRSIAQKSLDAGQPVP